MESYNPFSLEKKVILVTGASSGIGRATAIECSRMGARLIITGRNEQRLKETFDALTGEGHLLVVADLNEKDDLQRLVEQVSSINGLVLSAGRGVTRPFSFATREKLDKVFEINFFSQVELFRVLCKKKKITQKASVVAVASIGGTRHFELGNSIYGASKAALTSIMKYCAREFASKGIRVNTVCPGMINTPLIRQGMFTEEQLQEDMKLYPLKRYGEPEEVAHGIIYLLSDASSWVTGHSLIIDGGLTI